MNTLKLKLFIGVFAFVLLLPNTGSAYFTTDQNATRINDTTILFSITYKFGFSTRELYMPIMAIRGDQTSGTIPHLEYVILNSDGSTSTVGAASSIVLTKNKDLQIRDGQYYFPSPNSAEFTLISLLTIPKEQQTDNFDISLLVTSLPFTMVKDGTLIPAQLNPSELQYYRTPTINLVGSKSNTVSGSTHTLSSK